MFISTVFQRIASSLTIWCKTSKKVIFYLLRWESKQHCRQYLHKIRYTDFGENRGNGEGELDGAWLLQQRQLYHLIVIKSIIIFKIIYMGGCLGGRVRIFLCRILSKIMLNWPRRCSRVSILMDSKNWLIKICRITLKITLIHLWGSSWMGWISIKME